MRQPKPDSESLEKFSLFGGFTGFSDYAGVCKGKGLEMASLYMYIRT